MITYSLREEADYTARDISFATGKGILPSPLSGMRKPWGSSPLRVPGKHNISNALASIALADLLEIDPDTIQRGFQRFHGADRRFQYKGTFQGVAVIDDYAHHPTEIRATLTAAENYPHKHPVVRFSASHLHQDESSVFPVRPGAFSGGPGVILADIYAARETDTLGVSSADLAAAVSALGTECLYLPSFEAIEDFLKKNCSPRRFVDNYGGRRCCKYRRKT